MAAFIQLEDICFAYEDKPVLNKLNMSIEAGETVVLQGTNGCGKSTLLQLLNGLIFAERGKYLFNGNEINEQVMKKPEFAKGFHQRIGYLFQKTDAQLFTASVWEEIAFAPRQMQLPEEDIEKRVKDCLELLQIQELQDRAPYHLSGGEKKKVALATVLAMNPDVYILDEPLSGLDRESKKWLTDFLLQLKKLKKTILVATHDDGLADVLADRKIELVKAQNF